MKNNAHLVYFFISKTKNKNKFIETMERGAANSKNNFSENMKSIFFFHCKKEIEL